MTKKLTFIGPNTPRPVRRRPAGWGPKGWGRGAKALGLDIIRELVPHMNRLGYTPETFAAKCEISTDRFLQLTKPRNARKLDLKTISKWSAILGVDLIVSPIYRDGYFGRRGRQCVVIGPNFGPGIKSYLRAAKTSRVFGTPYIKPKHLR